MKTESSFLLKGVGIAVLGVFLESLLRLSYEHSALKGWLHDLSIWVLLTVRWPGLILDELFQLQMTDFTHPHCLGEDFWWLLLGYIVINGIGWSMLLSLMSKIGAAFSTSNVPSN